MTPLPWYHKTTIYQVYPRSFYDSNADGIGDLQGILQKLDYIHGLGFETIWISPFFSSPQADLGYDISDYTGIAPEYGTMDNVLQLIEEVHQRGMKIVFDMVMNHTSIEHEWFKESKSSRDNPKAEWYIWRSSPRPREEGLGVRAVPNNWNSVLGGSGWHYAEERGQYFWASFLPFQPDLNYRNPEVKKAMLDIVRFWLSKGVDGFRLDIFNYIYKDAQFRNNPFSYKLLPSEGDYSGFFQEALYTANQPEVYKFAREFRSICDEFGQRLSIGEVSGGTQVIRRFLGEQTNNGLTLVFDFDMMDFKFRAAYFSDLIEKMEKNYPHPFMPVYVFSHHDKRRASDRLRADVRKAKLLHMLQLTVRGVPCLYYGEEIGMLNSKLPFSTAQDPIPHKFKSIPRFIFDALGVTINRDEVRTPMQWDRTKNAGFSSAEKTWLPVHEDYHEINVEAQNKDEFSLLNTIRRLMRLRNQEPAFQEGSLQLIENLPRNVLGYARTLNQTTFFVLLNFGAETQGFPIQESIQAKEIVFKLSNENTLDGNKVWLDPLGGLILK